MTRPRQDRAIDRLERESVASIRSLEQSGLKTTERLWLRAKSAIGDEIAREYRRDFGGGAWNIVEAARFGTLARIDRQISNVLATFHADSVKAITASLRAIYKEGVLRHAWILDQVTPPSMPVKIPQSPVLFHEAAAVYRGPDAETAWKVRWSAWTDAYRAALDQNLRLGAINESSVGDAMDEVDATRPGSPQSDFWSALERIYSTQAAATYVMAAADVADANDQYDLEEIWQTRYYDRVCDICDENRGLTADEADSDIPAHPNCGCYWRLVPASWAELLRSGNEDDIALAQQMDAEGVVPSSMVIRNDGGDLVGASIVSFNAWSQENAKAIIAR